MSPSVDDPREKARALVQVKDEIEAEISLQLSILKANNCDMTTPLSQALPPPAPAEAPSAPKMDVDENLSPFAKVDGIAPGSPAAQAGLRREDLIVKFGLLTSASFSSSSLEPLADLVSLQ
ncbi:hypothetical protein JVU11DRAFT_3366 [Chiua virens]|nr:hypothetical protein JVU11DRAFT_3366 [Chiua virens]